MTAAQPIAISISSRVNDNVICLERSMSYVNGLVQDFGSQLDFDVSLYPKRTNEPRLSFSTGEPIVPPNEPNAYYALPSPKYLALSSLPSRFQTLTTWSSPGTTSRAWSLHFASSPSTSSTNPLIGLSTPTRIASHPSPSPPFPLVLGGTGETSSLRDTS